jgi:transcriptional regulator with XRE-family HTH domain
MKKSTKTQYEILMEDPEFQKELTIESLVLEASGIIAALMAEQGVTKADLARKLSKSPPWITQLLSGNANMTVRTLAEVAHALGAEVKLQTRALHASYSPKPQAPRYVIDSENRPTKGGKLPSLDPELAA